MPEPKPAKPRRAYAPPRVAEIVLDSNEVMLTPCTSNLVSTPPCAPPNFSILPVK